MAPAIARMTDASCDPSPSWACGAILLVPLTEDQVAESGLQLRPHNILALRSDQDSISRALGRLPKRKRPQLRAEMLLETAAEQSAVVECGQCRQQIVQHKGQERVGEFCSHAASSVQETGTHEATVDCHEDRCDALLCNCQVRVEVERTFLHYRFANSASWDSALVASAPCGEAGSPELANPRRSQSP